jgi:hypothetical protein
MANPRVHLPKLKAFLGEPCVTLLEGWLTHAGFGQPQDFWWNLLRLLPLEFFDLSHLLFQATSNNVIQARAAIRRAVTAAVAAMCLSSQSLQDDAQFSTLVKPTTSSTTEVGGVGGVGGIGGVGGSTDVPELAQRTVQLLHQQDTRYVDLQKQIKDVTQLLTEQAKRQQEMVDHIQLQDNQMQLMQNIMKTLAATFNEDD